MHSDERKSVDVQELQRGLRIVVLISVQDKVAGNLLDSKPLSVRNVEFVEIVGRHAGHARSDAIVVEGDGHQRYRITHTVLIDELRVESQYQTIARLECRVGNNRERIDVEATLLTKNERMVTRPDVGGIARIGKSRVLVDLAS